MFGWSFMSDETIAEIALTRVRTNRGARARTHVVCADLERLIATHHKPDLLRRLVREQADITCTALLPLGRARVKPEKLRPPMAPTKGIGEANQRVRWSGMMAMRERGRRRTS